MPQNSSQLIIGPAEFFIKAYTGAFPNLTGVAATDFADFDSPGYTQDGVEADHTTTDKEIRADEESDPIDVIIDKESNGINVKLIQTTMKNLYYSMAGATMPDDNTITFGGKFRPDLFTLGLVGPATREGKVRELLLYRCYAKTALKIKMQRTSEAVYQVSFMALADSTKPVLARTGIYKDF
jgi:hypothetical protein